MTKARGDLIAHIREQIEAGTYVTEGKLRIVVDKLVQEIVQERCERPSTSPPPPTTT